MYHTLVKFWSVFKLVWIEKLVYRVNFAMETLSGILSSLKAISALIQHDGKGVFHIANSEYCTWFTFGRYILEVLGIAGVRLRPITSNELNRAAARPHNSSFNCRKLEEARGITLRPWSEAVKEYLQSTKD